MDTILLITFCHFLMVPSVTPTKVDNSVISIKVDKRKIYKHMYNDVSKPVNLKILEDK